jgi:hypothetical protein
MTSLGFVAREADALFAELRCRPHANGKVTEISSE